MVIFSTAKGQIVPKKLSRAKDSPKNEQTALFFFAVKSSYVVKSNAVRLFFGRIYGAVGAPICFQFNLTFKLRQKSLFDQ